MHWKPAKRLKISPPSEVEKCTFFTVFKQVMPKAAVLSSVAPLNLSAPQSSVVKKLPALLTSLKDPKYSEMSKEELETVCQDVFRKLKVTSEESDYLEECTKLQAQSSLWHHHRTGQITSSIFKKVTRASPINPPSSLVKIILSESSLDSSKVPSLNWGITHEDAAREAYIDLVQQDHDNFECFHSGFRVNTQFHHLGASLDGIISCDCCGKGLIEIKCPYKYRDVHAHDVLHDSSFCLKKR